MTALLPERAGCPQCGSTDGKRWRSYSGVELCTDCEWEYFSDLNGRKFLDAKQQVQESLSRRKRTVESTLQRNSSGAENMRGVWKYGKIRSTSQDTLVPTSPGTQIRAQQSTSSLSSMSCQGGSQAEASTGTTLTLSRGTTGQLPRSVTNHPQRGLSRVGTPSAQDRRGSPSRLQPKDNWRCKWKPTLDKLVTPGYNSLCLLCGRIFYGAAMSSCSRCGGLCQQVSDHDLGLMGRNAKDLAEAQ